MDPHQAQLLVQRLIDDPHDQDALVRAHQAGAYDPEGYARLLETVAVGTADPTFAAHWFSEAASVWTATLGDHAQAARVLYAAVQRDATNRDAVERLAQIYRDAGQWPELVQVLELAAAAAAPLLASDPDCRPFLLGTLEELGRLLAQGQPADVERALAYYRQLVELDPQNALAIYSLRELLKSSGRYGEAAAYFASEQALVADPERKLVLFRDEAEVRRLAGDRAGSTQALRQARAQQPDDPALTYEFGLSVVERIDTGEPVPPLERQEAAQALLGLGELYDGEYGMMYAAAALKAAPGDDRAMQLADYYATALGRQAELRDQYVGYLRASPQGYMADVARANVGDQAMAMVPPAAPAAPYGVPAMAPGYEPQTPPAGAEAITEAPREATPEAAAGPVVPPAPAMPVVTVADLLAQADHEAQQGRKPQAYDKYRQALEIEPANPEALGWVVENLQQRRKFAELRDVLLVAARASTDPETRKAQLRDVVAICEQKLKDFDGAVVALKQIHQLDRGDEQARDHLYALLERTKRWDELAPLLEQQAMSEPDAEARIAIEKRLAQIHEKNRADPAAAGEVWARIATLAPGDEQALLTAAALLEQGGQVELAASTIGENLGSFVEVEPKCNLLFKLGELRGKLGDQGGAGEAFQQGAELGGAENLWEQAAQAFTSAGRFADAAAAVERRAERYEGARQAELLAQAGELLAQAGDSAGALMQLERAAELDPESDELAARVEARYEAEGRAAERVAFLQRRAERIAAPEKRAGLRHAAAALQQGLGDEDGCRDSLLLVLADGEDAPALQALCEIAARRGEHAEQVDYLGRLAALGAGGERLELALREAQVLGDGVGDVEGAIGRYRAILADLDASNQAALHAIAMLELRRENPSGAAEALERELALCAGEGRLDIARELGQLYVGPLGDPAAAIRIYELVHAGDPEDFDAVARLVRLCEKVQDWPRVAELLGKLIEVEGDEEEASEMTRRLAEIYAERLGRGDEALGALERLADQGDVACQQAYSELGLKLGWKGIVATKLVAWNEGAAGTSRADAMRRAFDLFVEVGRDEDARTVALELARSGDADLDLATSLEGICTRLRDLEALAVTHEILARSLSADSRAEELIRQADVMVQAGADPLEAIHHGEPGLGGLDPAAAEALLPRLATLTDAPGHIIDIYERQVARCRLPAERVKALARAAQVATDQGAVDRARDFFHAALSGGVHEETLASLEAAARNAQAEGGDALLRVLAEALAAGGQGSRDGGRTRCALLRRAAAIALRDLGDVERAFAWLGDSIIAQVDDASLAALDELGREVGDMSRVEGALNRALEDVYDGPLVRKLLRRRADLRRTSLGDVAGATADLKRLHDLTPGDQELTDELTALLGELRDHRGMIDLIEDQILRCRKPLVRAELARKVARIWEEDIGDTREAADAWRRVLRMKAGDKEATAGLERAKKGKLKAPPPVPAPSRPPPAYISSAPAVPSGPPTYGEEPITAEIAVPVTEDQPTRPDDTFPEPAPPPAAGGEAPAPQEPAPAPYAEPAADDTAAETPAWPEAALPGYDQAAGPAQLPGELVGPAQAGLAPEDVPPPLPVEADGVPAADAADQAYDAGEPPPEISVEPDDTERMRALDLDEMGGAVEILDDEAEPRGRG
ncbi:MAG: hypothetical protein HY744_01140 [Deltaproteobacteria bacterium]|nr:hypothetical protein [Deltaproteobacteria bacterium]